jgi:Ser/Thr protein kinase RdoA (MazF antagonist)
VWDLTRAIITGYQRHRPLSPEEVDVLGDFVLARLALTVAISARRSDQHKDNARYQPVRRAEPACPAGAEQHRGWRSD